MKKAQALRRVFARTLIAGLRVVWPILSGLIGAIVALGIVIGLLEDWPLHQSIYFAFITGLTIGYGDLVPRSPLTRSMAVLIGLCGLLLTALVAAVAVRALTATLDDAKK